MSNVVFDDENHTYTLISDNGEKINMVSVTQLLAKHGLSPDYSNVNENVLKAKAGRGTVVHEELSNYINKGEYGFTDELTQFIKQSKEKLIKPLKSEFMVHNGEIAGTVDIAGTIGENEVSFIGDFKTTATLHRESVAWQLSLYAHLSGNKYEKFLVIHFPTENTCKVIEIEPIAEEEIKELLRCERNCELYKKKTLELTKAEKEKIVAVQSELKELDERKKKLEKQESELKEFLISKMEETGVKQIDNELFKITYVSPQQRETIDSAKFKKEMPELATKFLKMSLVKASVRITLKD